MKIEIGLKRTGRLMWYADKKAKWEKSAVIDDGMFFSSMNVRKDGDDDIPADIFE